MFLKILLNPAGSLCFFDRPDRYAVGVDHGGFQAGMTKQHLDHADIVSGLDFFRENKFTLCLKVPYSAVDFVVRQCTKWRVTQLTNLKNKKGTRMESENGFLGYVKYTGSSVHEGFLDARKAAKALLRFDEAVRFFVKEDILELANSDFEIPVRMRKGSWEALIPDSIGQWIMTGTGIAATTYVTTTAKKLAENDFKDASITKAFHKALEGIQWFIKIGKHLGTVTQKKFTNLRWQNGNAEVGIPNVAQKFLPG